MDLGDEDEKKLEELCVLGLVVGGLPTWSAS